MSQNTQTGTNPGSGQEWSVLPSTAESFNEPTNDEMLGTAHHNHSDFGHDDETTESTEEHAAELIPKRRITEKVLGGVAILAGLGIGYFAIPENQNAISTASQNGNMAMSLSGMMTVAFGALVIHKSERH